ncbi:MAG: UDP-N-acetylmuramoyl-L-alanyl-D-glutamate--2,6-diaminopimelate ligase [Pseudomonadota bacterium]
MKLKELMAALETADLSGDPEVEFVSVEYDSRKVTPGALFAAVQGLALDGRRFIAAAVKSGAAAVLTDSPLAEDPRVPVITMPDARAGMALAAAALYGYPSRRLTMIGLTGTNGKTTTCYLLESILAAARYAPGLLGTVSVRYQGRERPSSLTTPEGPDLQKSLFEMLQAGVTHVVMEVASHALALRRVAGCRFDVGLFTNLTQDHLDFHGDLASYFEAKKLLFTDYLSGDHLPGGPKAVINLDDEWGRRLAAVLGSGAITYALQNEAEVRAVSVKSDRSGLRAVLNTPAGEFEVQSRLIGELNLYNLLAATAVSLALGLDPEVIAQGVAAMRGVPGRLERVGRSDDYLVLVDYAHTPDALSRVLQAVRHLQPKRLLTVFGGGGDRDNTKRPIMGRAAGELSDLAIVTSDNPRTEDPLSIIRQIEAGLSPLNLVRYAPEKINGSFRSGGYVIQPDRRSAIRLACRLLAPGDILVVAGKGHEDYQILGREKIHFDDREEAWAALVREGKS